MLNIILEQAKLKNKFPDFKLKQYSTPEEIECAHWNNEITIDDLINGETSAATLNEDGEEGEMTWAEHKESYEKMGFWGFVDLIDNTIHFWVKKDYPITLQELMFFFGHEMGHQMKGGVAPNEDDYQNNAEVHFKEEDRADEYAFVAMKAYEFAKTILEARGFPKGGYRL